MGNTSTADFGEATTNADACCMGESLNNPVKDIKLNSDKKELFNKMCRENHFLQMIPKSDFDEIMINFFKTNNVSALVNDIKYDGSTSLTDDEIEAIVRTYFSDKEEISEDVQYGVHDFNQQAIVFRGTEEECAEFIDDNGLWDDAEIYTITPNDPHYLKEAEEKLTTYYQIWAKGPSDSKYHFQDEYAYLNDLIDEAKGYMSGDADVRVIEVEEDESGNIVKRNGEVLFYSDSAIQTIDKELFDIATPQETADMFGKKVYSKKENKLYVPTGPVFEAAKLSPEEKLEREREKNLVT